MIRVELELWTDGACTGNPGGKGGWAYILIASKNGREVKKVALSGCEEGTTNNRMELRAVIEGLRALSRPTAITVTTDSRYISEAFIAGWVLNWERKGWRHGKQGKGKPVPNADLWQELLQLSRIHTLSWNRVKGHAGIPLNEECDALAVRAIRLGTPESFIPRIADPLQLKV